jgi:transcriptional regulator with XRE-family HTH domain
MKVGEYELSREEEWDIYSVGRKIREVREESGMTGKWLADRCDVTAAYIYQIENGMIIPSLNLISKVSRVYGLHPRDLL